MNGMLTSAAPVKSVGAVTVEAKPGMTEKEKSDLEQELEKIKERLQKTESELLEEKKLTESQVPHSLVNVYSCVARALQYYALLLLLGILWWISILERGWGPK